MIATITVQSHRMATQTQQDHHRFSLNSNTAGSPLPIIPRRPSQMRPALTHSPSLPLPTPSSLSTTSSAFSSSSSSTTVTPSYHHDDDTASSSSNSSVSDGSRPTIRTRRVRGVSTATRRNGTPSAMCPPELSTPIPTISTTTASPSGSSAFTATTRSDSAPVPRPPVAGPSRPMLYTPGMPLRLSMDSLSSASRNVSRTHVSPPTSNNNTNHSLASTSKSASALCETFGEERPIRKKSGALVKSSLKSSRSRSTSSLAVYTSPMSSKSEPGTPSSKVVHFDAKLEHVKLFLAEQKPLAVSRDGSPTDDTSGTDSDFPRFIFGSSSQVGGGDENKRVSRKRLVMHVTNMPVRAGNYSDDVALEELYLGPDGANILGKVRVRNLAFSKSIAVRFTFDSWQTTSEVTGKYLESPSPAFDRFTFTIRLNDLLARIEGKTLILAVRYSVDGQEIWDNNGGQNYLATFSKVKCDPPPGSDDEMSSDLRSRLEKVVQSKDRTGPAFAASRRHQPVPADPDVPSSFRTSTSFASRYDFASSLKSSWNPALHNRTQSFPLSNSRSSPSAILWPQKSPPSAALGSPRDKSDEVFVVTPEPHTGRNHSRSYFNLDSPSPALLKRTPPATPHSPSEFHGAPPAPARFNSFPPMESRTITTPTPLPSTTTRGPLGYDSALVPDSGDSELSTPSMVTPSSSRDSSPSPTEIFESHEDENMSPETHYRQFLNKCVAFLSCIRFFPDLFFVVDSASSQGLARYSSNTHPHPRQLASSTACLVHTQPRTSKSCYPSPPVSRRASRVSPP